MKRKIYIINLLLFIVSPIIFLSIMEIVTRLFWQYEVKGHHVGVILKGENRKVMHEGIIYRTNSKGIRYREIDDIRSYNKRVLALGDSFIWGDGLSEEELVTTKIEKMLQAKYPDAKVINAGISGHNTSDEFKQLVNLFPVYQPHHVILFFFTNDVLARDEIGKEGKVSAMSWRQNIKEYLRHKSKFFAFLYYQYKSKYIAKVGVPKALLPQDYFDLDESRRGWVAFKESLLKIQVYCKGNGATLQFVIIPTLTSLNENYPYMELHERVKNFATSQGVPVIDLFPVFARYSPAELWVDLENSHWNDKATSLAAEVIVENMEKENILN